MNLKEWIEIGKIYARYWVYFFRGRTVKPEQIDEDPLFEKVYDVMYEALNDYDPDDRDHIKRVYLHRKMIPPNRKVTVTRAAHWAAEAVLMVHKMNEGLMHPRAMAPLIRPQEIEYYDERVCEYIRMITGTNKRYKKVPVPFFYQIASERLRNILVAEQKEAAKARGKSKKPVLAAQH